EDGSIKKVSLQEIPQRGRYTKGVEILGSSRERLSDVVPLIGSVELMLVSGEGKVFYDRIEEKDLPLSRLDQRAKRRWDLEGDRLIRVVVKG
ncbi:MAG: DNA gyrase subunit A, partial [Aquificota bacterium]